MRQIAEGAELIEVNGTTFILAQVDPDTIDPLTAFEAEGADREDGDDDCCTATDDDPARRLLPGRCRGRRTERCDLTPTSPAK